MRRTTSAALRLTIVCGALGALVLWGLGVFALAIGVWQYAILALLIATGLALAAALAWWMRRRRAGQGY